MTGGGFGGAVIAVVPAAATADVAGAVTTRFAQHGWRSPAITSAEPSQGARRLY
jgi:galactokinase